MNIITVGIINILIIIDNQTSQRYTADHQQTNKQTNKQTERERESTDNERMSRTLARRMRVRVRVYPCLDTRLDSVD